MEGVICWGMRGSEKYGWWKFKQFYNKVCSYNHKGFKVIHLGLPLLLNDKFSKFVIREEIQEFFYLIKSWVLFLRYWLFSVFNIPWFPNLVSWWMLVLWVGGMGEGLHILLPDILFKRLHRSNTKFWKKSSFITFGG